MTIRLSFPAWILLIFPLWVAGQSRIGDWQSLTSVIRVRSAVEFEGKAVCTTSGGLLILDLETGEFETLTNIDGLVETDLGPLAVDRKGYLWMGSSAPIGIVQVYDLRSRQTVETFDFDLSEISDIAVSDSAVFVSFSQNLNWGILEFIWEDDRFQYRQVYRPSDNILSSIYDVEIRGDSLFAATESGLRVGDYRKYILNYPQNWDDLSGLEGNSVTRLRKSGSELLIVSDGRVWTLDAGILRQVSGRLSDLRDIIRDGNGILYGIRSSRKTLVQFGPSGSPDEEWTLRPVPNSITLLSDGNLLVSTDLGIGLWNPALEAFTWHTPNSPVSNVYTALAVLDDGRLVAAGKDGVSILTDYGWYNFVPSRSKSAIYVYEPGDFSSFVADTAQVKSSRVWSVIQRQDRIFFSLQGVLPDTNEHGDHIGGGIVSFDLNRPWDYSVYDTTGDRLNSWDEKGYMNVRGLAVDREDNLWVSNFAARDLNKKIDVVMPDGSWHHIPQTDLPASRKLHNPTGILVLDNGRVLVGGNQDHRHSGGLFVATVDLDETPLSVQWNSFLEEDGLASSTIWSLDSQVPGVAWILTSAGLQSISFNPEYTEIRHYSFTYFAGVPLPEGSKVRMDSRGNVWIASVTGGVYVLLANSTPWPDWNGFRHATSPLLSDEVSAIDFDNERGIAYIATSKGINALRIPFASQRKTFETVTTFPSPFRIPSPDPMVIDGLIDNSSIKIMTLTGRVLKDIQSTSPSVKGYQAFWDGRTDKGDYVGTGVYLVAIYSGSGETHVTKIAVIRQ
ncbi:MAG: hypothetical protein ACE5HZ_06685 [Fidelibacterota bacterium]